jgi:hypothetical protein
LQSFDLFDVATKGSFYSLTRNPAGIISLRDKWTIGESAGQVAFGGTGACLAREDEVKGEGNRDNQFNEFGFRSFVPSSMTDTDQYWHGVKEKCFALASKLRPPTFFLAFTMNPYCPEYQSLKRGTGNFSDGFMAAIVFRARLKGLMQFCTTSRAVGYVRAFVWRMEYQ